MKKFLADMFNEKESNVIVFGVPLGKNGKKEIDSIRDVSWFVETYDLDKKIDMLEDVRIFDSGDLKKPSLKEITERTKKIIESGKIPFILGGNHLSSLYSIQAVPTDTKLVVFDAHCDLKNEYMDEKIKEMGILGEKNVVNKKTNDATWLRRLCELRNPKSIIVLGVRSGDEEEIKFMKENSILYYTSNDIKNNMNEVRLILHQFTKLSKVYVSLDVDVFDPSIAPAVDHPEANGINFDHFKELLSVIYGEIIGMDVCCLRPMKDNQITEFLTVRAIFEILRKI